MLLLGACAGSTSGGVKMIRYQLLIKNSLVEVKRLLHPNAIVPVRHNGKAVPNEIIAKVSAFVLTYLGIFAFGSFTAFNNWIRFKIFYGFCCCLYG